jgi:hypothetical protein
VTGAGACSQPVTTFVATPIPVALSQPGGALVSLATVDGVPAPFPVVIDTGTPLTAYDDGTGRVASRTGTFRLFAQAPSGAVPRLEIAGVPLFTTPLAPVGVGAQFAVSGVLGGDNLERLGVAFDYRGAAPTITLSHGVVPCGCELAAACQAVLPFALAGGQQTIALGTDFYTYPATRVIVDACLEPRADPLVDDVVCNNNGSPAMPDDPRYLPHGVDVKLLVATGFPGVAIGKAAFTRLRDPSAAAAAFAAPATLFVPDAPGGITVGTATLGGSGLMAMSLTSRELFLGPCAELARSWRQRRSPFSHPRPGEAACTLHQACGDRPNLPDACDDTSDFAHTASTIELTAPMPVLVVDDSSPLMQNINADVITPQPNPTPPPAPAIEGILGTTALARLVTTVDYPHGRVVTRCASGADCLMYPRIVVPSQQSECENPGLCNAVDLSAPCAPAP